MCSGGVCVAKAAVCGDGVKQAGEDCDDGNSQNWDACSNLCKLNSFASDPCGYLEDGVWLNIDYKNAGSVYSPAWSYSKTPGFGEAQWAPQGKSWPEINAKGPPKMSNDPIGTVADIGSGQWLRIMFGLPTLQSYESATVCITGRSISVGSSVTVDLRNPALGLCGGQVMLSNSWQVHASGLTMPGMCLAPGNSFQALQIEPTGGSSKLGLRSARITLHKPVF
jgi:cysteine-rich repeat protein